MFEIETKNVAAQLEIKADKQGLVTAYASVFGNVDSYGDIVQKGAFTKTLLESKSKIKALRDHDFYRIAGKPVEVEQDNTGLLTVTKMMPTDIGRETLILIEENAIEELSIGYQTVQADYDDRTGGRNLRELKLFEYSFLGFPAANPLALVQSVKSASDLEQAIKTWHRILDVDFKAGKVLSKGNAKKVLAALEALREVLTAAGIDEAANSTSDEDGEKQARLPVEKPQFEGLFEGLKQIRGDVQKQAALQEFKRFAEEIGQRG